MSKTLKMAGVISGAATITGTAMFATPAHATITWKAEDGKYLEIYQQGKNNGNWADIYKWNGGNNQKWSAVNLGRDTHGNTEWAFVNYNSGKCLEDYRYETTGHVDQWSCGNYGSNTRWQEVYNPFGNSPPDNTYAIWNYGNNKQLCPDTTSWFWVIWGNQTPAYCEWA